MCKVLHLYKMHFTYFIIWLAIPADLLANDRNKVVYADLFLLEEL